MSLLNHFKNNRDIILVLYGGETAGVFGAGVVTEFDRQDFDKRIDSIQIQNFNLQCSKHVLNLSI